MLMVYLRVDYGVWDDIFVILNFGIEFIIVVVV